jgi:hypothetical protein
MARAPSPCITMKKVFIITLLFASLAGLIYSALALYQAELSLLQADWNSSTFKQPAAWLAVTLLLSLGLLAVSVWLLVRSLNSDIHSKFKGIDSDTLDGGEHVCMDFYNMAYEYRCKYGGSNYDKNILKHFSFFYDFHNDALEWIDEIVLRTSPFTPPGQFIISAICSGHIGQVFSELQYDSGLENINLPKGSPMLAYAKADRVELWSKTHDLPVCTLSNKRLELKRAKKQNETVTGVLIAEDKHTQDPVSIKLVFPDYQFDAKQNRRCRHDIYKTRNYHRFQEWLSNTQTMLLTSRESNFGIRVSDEVDFNYGVEVDYGIPATELIKTAQMRVQSLQSWLDRLVGKKIDAYFDRKKMSIVKSKSPLDAVILCSNLGLLTITEERSTGKISYNSDAGWIVYHNNRSQIIPNACLRAQRAKTSLMSLLKKHNLLKWPVYSLVVFSADDVELQKEAGKTRVQCDVIKIDELEYWLSRNSGDPSVRFTKDDYNTLALLLNRKTRQYKEKVAGHA